MHRIIVLAFTTLDGVVDDPDGSFGSPIGGWALRAGPQVFAGDKFGVGPLLETGALIFGRRTWERFSQRWPARTGPFADAMNRSRKLVASGGLLDLGAWSGSELLDGPLVPTLRRHRVERDLIVVGSTSIVHALAAQGLVDEYRLMVLPVTVGTGHRLFPPGAPARDLTLLAAEPSDGNLLLRYGAAASEGG